MSQASNSQLSTSNSQRPEGHGPMQPEVRAEFWAWWDRVNKDRLFEAILRGRTDVALETAAWWAWKEVTSGKVTGDRCRKEGGV